MAGKRASFDLYGDWVEYLFLLLLVVGFIMGFAVRAPVIHYIIIFLVGMIVGRLFYLKKKYLPFPRYLITFGFVLGFIVGSIASNWKVLVFLFFVGAYTGYKLHEAHFIQEFF